MKTLFLSQMRRRCTSVSRLLTGVLLFALAASIMQAQNTAGFGSISGVVQDPTGAVVPGAKVVVENPSKGIRRELVSNSAGQFNAPNLVPASGYQVSITSTGFASYQAKDITIEVGNTVTINPSLRVNASESVDVSTSSQLLDQTKTDVSQVVNSAQIQELPINGRRVDTFVLLTPGVASDGSFGLISFRGNPGGNSFLTDGNDTTNQFYDENAGRTRTYNISQDAVQEFQVVSSNFLAEYGRASGGVVNTVTRSGTNDFHGTAYEFFRNRTLSATDITANHVNPPEWRHQAGASIGGPIVKNKLFFFFNGELQRRSAPIVSTNSNNALFDANGNYIPGNCTTTPTKSNPIVPTQAQCNAAIAYLQGRVATQLIPRTVDTNLAFGKIDYQLNEKNSFSFSSNYVDFRSPNGIQTQLSLTGGNGIGNNANTTVFNRTARASWTHIFSSNIVNELRFGYFKDRQFDPASPSLLPSIGPVGLTVNGVSNVGYATGYPRLNPSEQRYQAVDNLSWTLGKHNLKFGVDYAHVDDFVSRLANQYGTYTYSTLNNFALDFSGNNTGKHWQTFSQTFGNPVVETALNEFSTYVQDQWRVSSRLTVSPGVRYEYTGIPQPPQPNPVVPQTGHIRQTNLNLAPRLGIAYTLTPTTVLRGGYGLFFNRYTSSTIENLFVSNGLYQSSYSLRGSVASNLAAGPVFPNALAATPVGATGSSTLIYSDNTFRNPYSEQADLAIEQQFAHNTNLSVSYVWSRGAHLLQTYDANMGAPKYSYTFPVLDASGAQVSSYTTPIYTQDARINPSQGAQNVLQSSGNSYYSGLLVGLNSRFANWLQGSISYTYSHAIDDNQGGGGNTLFGSSFPTSVFNGNYAGEKGSSSIDQRHRLVANAIFAPTFMHSDSWEARYLVNNWQLSVVELAASSQPLAPTIRVSDAAILPTQPKGQPPLSIVSFFSLNGLGGSNRVPFESTSALNIGSQFRTDARITKMFPITERVKLNLGFEAFNIFNHPILGGPSPRTTQQYTSIKQTSGPLAGQVALVPYAPYGSILQTQAPPDGTTARRAQVLVRLVF